MKPKVCLAIFFTFFITGCSEIDKTSEIFTLKEKCSHYIVKERERFEKENSHLRHSILDGLFYSKTLETCVAKWDWVNNDGQQFYEYVDVLTSESLQDFLPFEKDENGIVQINSKRDNEIVTKEAVEYEKTLELVK